MLIILLRVLVVFMISIRFQWLTTHEPSTEHELTGLRDNFTPAARWRKAITTARAISRLSSLARHNSGQDDSPAESGNWKGESSDEDGPENIAHPEHINVHTEESARLPTENPVKATSAGDTSVGKTTGVDVPAPGHELKRQEDPAHEKLAVDDKVGAQAEDEGLSLRQNVSHNSTKPPYQESAMSHEEEDALNMPGSFYIRQHHSHGRGEGHEGLFEKLFKRWTGGS